MSSSSGLGPSVLLCELPGIDLALCLANPLGQLHHQLFSPWRVIRSSPRWLLHLARRFYGESSHGELYTGGWIIGQYLRHARNFSRHCDSKAPHTIYSRRNGQCHTGNGIGSIHHIHHNFSRHNNSSFCHLGYDVSLDSHWWQSCSDCYRRGCDFCHLDYHVSLVSHGWQYYSDQHPRGRDFYPLDYDLRLDSVGWQYCSDSSHRGCVYCARNYRRRENIHDYFRNCAFRNEKELRICPVAKWFCFG